MLRYRINVLYNGRFESKTSVKAVIEDVMVVANDVHATSESSRSAFPSSGVVRRRWRSLLAYQSAVGSPGGSSSWVITAEAPSIVQMSEDISSSCHKLQMKHPQNMRPEILLCTSTSTLLSAGISEATWSKKMQAYLKERESATNPADVTRRMLDVPSGVDQRTRRRYNEFPRAKAPPPTRYLCPYSCPAAPEPRRRTRISAHSH
ncbi:hypothetical protein B0H12DRAFT_1127069 [Mycena haematopus]|nr:hypothetical protein B0H12DRAFT_1127069 [Mycena haematopus]